jgi:hypothetical protein
MAVRRRRTRRNKQQGRAIVRFEGDRGEVLFPDLGAKPLRVFIRRYQTKMSDGYGSHMNGKHKLG